MPKNNPKLQSHRSWLVANIEVIFLSVIVALLIRHFCLAAFKIPTSSMEPTLIGDPRCGDRIIVNKTAFLFKKPKRWDVIVFKYPLNQKRNFIKRLIGLPGETVQIKNGDIYIDGLLARKPAHIQKALLYPLYDDQLNLNFTKHWNAESEHWKKEEKQIAVESSEESWLNYTRLITNEYSPKRDKLFFNRSNLAPPIGGDYNIGELFFQCEVKPMEKQGNVLLSIREDQNRFVCQLSSKPEESTLFWYQQESPNPHQSLKISESLPLQKWSQIRFSNLDDLVQVYLNNKLVASLDYQKEYSDAQAKTYESNFRIGISEGHFLWQKMLLKRDIYYIGKKDLFAGEYTWEVPPGHLFGLGDNPPNSQDSRSWEKFCFFQANGLALQGDQRDYPYGLVCQFSDIYGRKYNLPRKSLRRQHFNHLEAAYVPQKNLIGQAVFVFWPPVRMKVIH